MIRRNIVCLLLTVFLLTVSLAEAQQQAKIPKIGFLSAGFDSGGSSSWRDSFKREFLNLGYVEGKNIAFEYRNADTKYDRLPALADELVRLKVDVIVTPGANDTRAAKNATKTVPIVFTGGGSDPVTLGLVDSLARPGGNVTGFAQIASVLAGKRLSCSRKPFPSFPALPCCGIQKTPALRKYGKKANCGQENWACSYML